MSKGRQRFEEFFTRFGDCYKSVEVRVVCGLREGQWRNIWTRMELRPEAESEIQTRADLPSTDAIKAIHLVSPSGSVRDLMDSVERGKLSLGDTEVVYLRDGHKPDELGLPFSSFTTPNQDFAVRAGLEDWRSARLRANGPDLLSNYLDLDTSRLDGLLRVQQRPYLGLKDILDDFVFRHVGRYGGNENTGVLICAPLMVCFGECACSDRKLHILAECHPAFRDRPARIGLVERRPDGDVERTHMDICAEVGKVIAG